MTHAQRDVVLPAWDTTPSELTDTLERWNRQTCDYYSNVSWETLPEPNQTEYRCTMSDAAYADALDTTIPRMMALQQRCLECLGNEERDRETLPIGTPGVTIHILLWMTRAAMLFFVQRCVAAQNARPMRAPMFHSELNLMFGVDACTPDSYGRLFDDMAEWCPFMIWRSVPVVSWTMAQIHTAISACLRLVHTLPLTLTDDQLDSLLLYVEWIEQAAARLLFDMSDGTMLNDDQLCSRMYTLTEIATLDRMTRVDREAEEARMAADSNALYHVTYRGIWLLSEFCTYMRVLLQECSLEVRSDFSPTTAQYMALAAWLKDRRLEVLYPVPSEYQRVAVDFFLRPLDRGMYRVFDANSGGTDVRQAYLLLKLLRPYEIVDRAETTVPYAMAAQTLMAIDAFMSQCMTKFRWSGTFVVWGRDFPVLHRVLLTDQLPRVVYYRDGVFGTWDPETDSIQTGYVPVQETQQTLLMESVARAIPQATDLFRQQTADKTLVFGCKAMGSLICAILVWVQLMKRVPDSHAFMTMSNMRQRVQALEEIVRHLAMNMQHGQGMGLVEMTM
jgi:hypothetical protein